MECEVCNNGKVVYKCVLYDNQVFVKMTNLHAISARQSRVAYVETDATTIKINGVHVNMERRVQTAVRSSARHARKRQWQM